MHILIGLDGLSLADFVELQSLLPKTRQALSSLSEHVVQSIFSCAQPIWAELLTASPWHKNGCSGYARPNGSLNVLKVFDENDLNKAVVFRKTGLAPSAYINIPFVRPRNDGSAWLADGSLPINLIVTPRSLRSSPPFDTYEAKPFPSIAAANGKTEQLVDRCIEIEHKRLACALKLLSTNEYSNLIYRITIFDQLSHLLGLRFLAATDLSAWLKVKQFVDSLDNALSVMFSFPSAEICIVSAYSHTTCRGILSLNTILQRELLLALRDSSNESFAHGDVFQIANAFKTRPIGAANPSFEGRLDPLRTFAASPTANCIFVNSRSTFRDGVVDSSEYASVKESVRKVLHRTIAGPFGNHAVIEELPLSESPTEPIPEFIVNVRAFEFTNLTGEPLIPLTTHSPGGFMLAPRRLGTSTRLKPHEIAGFLGHPHASC